MSEVTDIDAKLKALGVRAVRARKPRKAPTRRRRRRAGMPLRVYIENALARAKRPMKVKDIEEAVRKAGYKTRAKDLYHGIFVLLGKSSNVQRVGKGMYAIKKGSKPSSKRKSKKAKA